MGEKTQKLCIYEEHINGHVFILEVLRGVRCLGYTVVDLIKKLYLV